MFEPGSHQVFHVHKRGRGEHKGLVKEQTELSITTVSMADSHQSILHVQDRHVRMHKLEEGLKQSAFQLASWEREGMLLVQELDK